MHLLALLVFELVSLCLGAMVLASQEANTILAHLYSRRAQGAYLWSQRRSPLSGLLWNGDRDSELYGRDSSTRQIYRRRPFSRELGTQVWKRETGTGSEGKRFEKKEHERGLERRFLKKCFGRCGKAAADGQAVQSKSPEGKNNLNAQNPNTLSINTQNPNALTINTQNLYAQNINAHSIRAHHLNAPTSNQRGPSPRPSSPQGSKRMERHFSQRSPRANINIQIAQPQRVAQKDQATQWSPQQSPRKSQGHGSQKQQESKSSRDGLKQSPLDSIEQVSKDGQHPETSQAHKSQQQHSRDSAKSSLPDSFGIDQRQRQRSGKSKGESPRQGGGSQAGGFRGSYPRARQTESRLERAASAGSYREPSQLRPLSVGLGRAQSDPHLLPPEMQTVNPVLGRIRGAQTTRSWDIPAKYSGQGQDTRKSSSPSSEGQSSGTQRKPHWQTNPVYSPGTSSEGQSQRGTTLRDQRSPTKPPKSPR